MLRGAGVFRVVAAALPLLGGVLAAAAQGQATTRNLTIEQEGAADKAARQSGSLQSGSLKVRVSADRPDSTYAIGETARLFVTANEDAHVIVFDIGPSGQVTQLFPNAFQPDDQLRANQTVEIAGKGTGAHIRISGPAGIELVKVIASSRRLPMFGKDKLKGGGVFRSLDGGVPALMRDLSVAADATPGAERRRMYTTDFYLRTARSP